MNLKRSTGKLAKEKHLLIMNLYARKQIDPILAGKLKKYVFEIVGCCQDVHSEQGPELTEYVYQESLAIAFEQQGIPFVKEYWFQPYFRSVKLQTKMRVDFFCKNKVFVECKAIDKLVIHERLQLWAYMRAANIRIGILYNFLPVLDECEKYYFDPEDNSIGVF